MTGHPEKIKIQPTWYLRVFSNSFSFLIGQIDQEQAGKVPDWGWFCLLWWVCCLFKVSLPPGLRHHSWQLSLLLCSELFTKLACSEGNTGAPVFPEGMCPMSKKAEPRVWGGHELVRKPSFSEADYEEEAKVSFLSVLLCFWILHISEITWYLSFSIWLILLSTIPSRSIRAVRNGRIENITSNIVISCYGKTG